MFSHVVIFWTDPKKSNAADELLAGAKKYLAGIPGILHFHIGKMASSHRPVVWSLPEPMCVPSSSGGTSRPVAGLIR